MKHDIRELILKECKAKYPEGVSFSDLKVRLMDREKIIKGKSTLSKYLKVLVKEGLLERDVDTRRYRITQEGLAFLNEAEILTRQIRERVRRPYIFDEAEQLGGSASLAGKEEREFIRDFVTKFLRSRRKNKEAHIFRLPTELLAYWRKSIPFECQIYLVKEFSKHFDDFLKELERGYSFTSLSSFFYDVADALYKVVSRDTLINRRGHQKEGYHTSFLRESVEKVELLKRSGFILVAWPRTPGWLQQIEEEGGLELALKRADELDKFDEENRKKMQEAFKNDPNARRIIVRYYVLNRLFNHISGPLSNLTETCERLKEQGASKDEALKKLKEEEIENIKREVLKGIRNFCESEPKLEEIDGEIKWIEEQGYLDALVRYVWAKGEIINMWRKILLESRGAIKT